MTLEAPASQRPTRLIRCLLALALAAGGPGLSARADDTPPGPTIEEMLRVSLERRAAAEARVKGVLDEIFVTLENNQASSPVAVAARERLTGETFAIALPLLVQALESPNGHLARSCALRLRDAAAAAPGSLPKSAIQKLVEILKGPSARAKQEAFVVARVLRPDEIGPTIRELASASDDGATRREAMDILKNWRDPEGIAAFRAALGAKEEPATRRAGIEAIVAIGDRASLPLVEPLVGDPSHDVRRAAFAALGALGNESVLPTLYAQLEEILRDPDMRTGGAVAGPLANAALAAIGSIGSPSSLPALRALQSSCPEPVQVELRAACGKILSRILAEKRSDALPEVRPFLDDAQPALRDLAFDIVGALADKESIPILVKKLESQSPAILKKVAETLGLMGERQIAFKLRPLLKNDSSEVQIAAAIALGRLKDYSGEEILVKPLELRLRENKNDVSARLELARNYKLILKYKSAVSEYREALKMRGSKDEAEIWLQIAACHALDGKIEDGKKALDQAKSRGADVGKALAERGELAPLR